MTQQQQLWQPGNYIGDLVSAAFGKASTGTQQVVFTFDIEGNRKLIFAFLSDACQERTFDDLEKMGWNGSASDPKFENPKGIELYMKIEKYDGKDQEKWSISSGGFKPEPMQQDETRRIEALWKNRGKPGASSKPSTPAPSRTPAPSKSGGAPSRPAPVDNADKFNKDDAWNVFAKANKTGDDFYEVIAAVEKEKGIEETKFTAGEWRYVAGTAGTPF